MSQRYTTPARRPFNSSRRPLTYVLDQKVSPTYCYYSYYQETPGNLITTIIYKWNVIELMDTSLIQREMSQQ